MVFGLQVEHVGGNGRHLRDELLIASAPDTNANPFPPFPDRNALPPENLFTLTQLARMLKRKRSKKKKVLWKSGKRSPQVLTAPPSMRAFPTFPQALLRLLEQTLLSLTPPNVQDTKSTKKTSPTNRDNSY
jgi:hypothetical protein